MSPNEFRAELQEVGLVGPSRRSTHMSYGPVAQAIDNGAGPFSITNRVGQIEFGQHLASSNSRGSFCQEPYLLQKGEQQSRCGRSAESAGVASSSPGRRSFISESSMPSSMEIDSVLDYDDAK